MISRARNRHLAPKVSRSVSHIKNVSATTTAITSTSFETDMPPISGVVVVEDTPTMKSRMPCHIA